jgi:hypothetical protein
VSGTVTAAVLGVFAFATLVLVQFRQLIREIARTIEEWQKLRRTLSREGRNAEPQTEKCVDEDPQSLISSQGEEPTD